MFNRMMFWLFTFNFIFLGYLGSQLPVYPYIQLGVICSHFHLFYFLILPVINGARFQNYFTLLKVRY